ncbi:MAG: RNA polymerase sigma factor [Brevinematales bacterium]|nr:RNA polymerase sigma factor [Brevinematales bacterium]
MSVNSMSDEEILYRICELKKDESSYAQVIKTYYEELYNRYYLQCYNISRYYGLSKQDAEDVVQESFLKFMMRDRTFERGKLFKPWFFRILINTIKDRYKYLKKNRFINIEKFEEIDIPEAKNDIENFTVKESLEVIINKLPEKLKKVVLLKNFSDMSLEDIAKESNISIRQLHNRLSKAYQIILKELKK